MLPDNRLRFPTALIDFATEVGLTGQAHEDFPAPAVQPRYDWLLMWFISLLGNQSSFEEPSEYTEGTLWFDLESGGIIRIRTNNEWKSLADVIAVEEASGTDGITTLSQWFTETTAALNTTAPESTFSGVSTQDGVTSIPIPESLQDTIDTTKNKPFLYINGLLIDPRNVRFCNETTVELLNGVTIDQNDTFTVLIKNITDELFNVPSVVL